eukprot:g2123.t1 g2123   contig11:764820-765098(+)
MSFFPNSNLVSSNDDYKENITPNRRKAVASSALSPVEKRLKKTAADSKLIHLAKKTVRMNPFIASSNKSMARMELLKQHSLPRSTKERMSFA